MHEDIFHILITCNAIHELTAPVKGKTTYDILSTFETLFKTVKAILDKVYFAAEAWSRNSLYFNSQNSRIRSTKTLRIFHKQSLHSLKVEVRCRGST